MRVLGIDPGLTRCGVGIVSGVSGSSLTLDGVGVIMTDTAIDLDLRLLELHSRMTEWVLKYSPDVMAVERVFSQHNVRTVMGTAQAAGIALLVAAQNNIPVFLHTPSEVKAAVTGSGRANKSQVSEMVKRLLNLKEIPKPADSADALALAICHIWRGAGESKIKSALAAEKKRLATLR
jgi:crossover junction endodeoxyribonuclease RuvC|uniref:crossover junction endodeoxyribonuclease RuvC n=1 Tax=Candidatus Planktophila sp. TaxID=2175601 RepID=UPI004049AB63